MVLKMKKRQRKPKTLRRFFTGYLAVFCVATIFFTILIAFSFILLITTGFILPANYGEQMISEQKDTIQNSKTVTPDQIPDTCTYAVFTKQGKLLSGDLSREEARTAWEVTQTQGRNYFSHYYYVTIPRTNELCIIRYTLVTQYRPPLLRSILPSPDIFFFLLFLVGLILEVFLIAASFGKKLTGKLRSLQSATEKIQNQDLNFSVESSGIYEIDNVLDSISTMKEALKTSLQEQWTLQQNRRDQISALAHDIKTPITVVKGNADLLLETDLTPEQKEYTGYITDSSRQMEQYLKTLLEISKAESGYSLKKERLNTAAFLETVKKQISALTAVRKLSLDFQSESLPQSFCADSDLIQRAILNIVSNAVDFSPEQGTLLFRAFSAGNSIRFQIIDSGTGFSAEALKNAAQQFYMGDKSRSSKAHYGMGLFIANTIVRQHGGRLCLENSEETGGGKVTVEIRADQKTCQSVSPKD